MERRGAGEAAPQASEGAGPEAAEGEAAAAEAAAEAGGPKAEAAAAEAAAEAGGPEAEAAGAAGAAGPEGAEDQRRDEKDAGNEAYARGDFEEAVKAWGRSLSSVKYILNKGLYAEKPQQQQEVEAMELRLCLNLAQGYLKTGDWANAVSSADKVLAKDAAHPKALYRKASALVQQQSFREATAVLERLLEVEPQNAAALSMAAEARRSAQLSDRKAKRVSQKMFAALAEDRDPRVPPSRREALLAAARAALAGALRFLRELPQRCRELASPGGARALLASLRRWWGAAEGGKEA